MYGKQACRSDRFLPIFSPFNVLRVGEGYLRRNIEKLCTDERKDANLRRMKEFRWLAGAGWSRWLVDKNACTVGEGFDRNADVEISTHTTNITLITIHLYVVRKANSHRERDLVVIRSKQDIPSGVASLEAARVRASSRDMCVRESTGRVLHLGMENSGESDADTGSICTEVFIDTADADLSRQATKYGVQTNPGDAAFWTRTKYFTFLDVDRRHLDRELYSESMKYRERSKQNLKIQGMYIVPRFYEPFYGRHLALFGSEVGLGEAKGTSINYSDPPAYSRPSGRVSVEPPLCRRPSHRRTIPPVIHPSVFSSASYLSKFDGTRASVPSTPRPWDPLDNPSRGRSTDWTGDERVHHTQTALKLILHHHAFLGWRAYECFVGMRSVGLELEPESLKNSLLSTCSREEAHDCSAQMMRAYIHTRNAA
ncbi:hypothetical protein SCHPADRAFT_889549 [Schizopora paradoxa]|uniref:Uncharacterized protein n=1 Tax=Schizopora paradoxa TaxID=27342 RepID=A0A0H2RXA5_9AGAM|nr:hypothetical protein SCHPADRAFT_889549 [Schizopora paradoxa]